MNIVFDQVTCFENTDWTRLGEINSKNRGII